MSAEALFDPIRIGSLELKNRIVMSPMTRGCSPGGVPTDEVAAYYRRRAEGEVALLISEGTVVDRPASKSNPRVPDFHGAALDGWARVAAAVHDAGARMAPQLWHVGGVPDARNPEWAAAVRDSPSGISAEGDRVGDAMSEEEIADTVAAFARSAAAAARLGFDALELHGGHGYLIDQFFWHVTNSRADAWGGSGLAERTRFAAEIVRQVRAALPAGMPLSLRLSQWKISNYEARLASTPDEMAAWLEPLAAAGVDIFHCSQRRFWEPEFEGSDLNFAGWAKKLTGKATITVGSVGMTSDFFGGEIAAAGTSSRRSIAELVRRLERGDFDLVAVGRALLGDPHWARRVREGRFDELVPFDRSALARLQ